ncbi:MAG: hypothetical protein ACXWE6_13310, partial [Nitrososphaeraceae archaeon]
VSRIMTGHRPPKGDFTDILSSDCQFHLIPLLLSYIFKSRTHLTSLIMIISMIKTSGYVTLL